MKNTNSMSIGLAGLPKPPENVCFFSTLFWHWRHPLPATVKQAEMDAANKALAESCELRQQSAAIRARTQLLLAKV